MSDRALAWWEHRAGEFQRTADLPVGVNWGPFGGTDLELLNADLTGHRAIELGCGGGQGAVDLADRGATVLGVDLSAAQLAHARRLAADRGVADAVALCRATITDLPVADRRFDLAVSTWVCQWVPDLDAAVGEARRVLRPGGRLILAVPHPVFRLGDPETGEVTGSYFEVGPEVTAVEGADGVRREMVLYRRTVSAYHRALVDAGLRVEGLFEPGRPDPEAYPGDRWGQFTPDLRARLPAALVLDARRPTAG